MGSKNETRQADPTGEKRAATAKLTKISWTLQRHRDGDKELRAWTSKAPHEGYSVEEQPDGTFTARMTDPPLNWSGIATAATAKKKCRQHAAAPPAEQKPRREKGSWAVRVMPSPQLLAELAPKQAANTREIALLKGQIAASAEAHRELKKRKEGEIEEIEETQGRLADEVEHGVTTTLECYRERVGDEWVFTSEDGAEIDRQPAADGPQQKLVSDFAAPRAWQDQQRTALVLELLGRDYPPEGEPETDWPWSADGWHPLVEACANRLVLDTDLCGWEMAPEFAADPGIVAMLRHEEPGETDGVRHPGDEQADPARGYTEEEVTFRRGSTVSTCGRYSLRKQNGLWCPCLGADGEIDLPRAAAHTSKRDAVAQCQEHLDSQLAGDRTMDQQEAQKACQDHAEGGTP